MSVVLTMDQIKRIYDELVGYDPSLAKNKDAVLQLIQKMVDAKPQIQVDPQWKDLFADQLQEHIARNKVYLRPASSRFTQWIAKWSLSFASLWVALLVVWASYYWWQSDIKPRQKNTNTNNAKIAVKSDVNTWDSLVDDMQMENDSNSPSVAATALVKVAPPMLEDTKAQVAISYDNGEGELDLNARVGDEEDLMMAVRSSWTESTSTEVDIATTSMMKETPRYETMWGIWGGIDPEMIWSDAPTIPAATSMIAPAVVNDPAVQQAASNQVVLVITDKQGVLFDSPALEIVTQYGVSVSVIPYNTAQAEKLEKQWFAITDFLISGSQNGVVYIDAKEIQTNPNTLRQMIEKYQSEWFVFAEVSAKQ